MPKCDLPIDVYIYCTKDKKSGLHYSKEYGAFNDLVNNCEHYSTIGDGCGKVVAKFTLNNVEEIKWHRESVTNLDYYRIEEQLENEKLLDKSCLSMRELKDYLKIKGYYGDNLGWQFKLGYAWHISNLVIFDKPKKLSEFEKVGSYNNSTIKCKKKEQGRCNYGKSEFTGKWVGCEKARLTKAPQSWCYVETLL